VSVIMDDLLFFPPPLVVFLSPALGWGLRVSKVVSVGWFSFWTLMDEACLFSGIC
jgi:hypothetical protein